MIVWMEVKVISDCVLTMGGLTIGALFLRQVYKAVNYLARIAGEFMVLTTHTQPDTLRMAIEGAIHGGPTALERALFPPATLKPQLERSISQGPDDDYPEDKDPQDDYDGVPPGGCMADFDAGEQEQKKFRSFKDWVLEQKKKPVVDNEGLMD